MDALLEQVASRGGSFCFVEGRREEVYELFGYPAPILPRTAAPAMAHDPLFLVELHARLKPYFIAFLHSTYRSLMEGVVPKGGEQEEVKAAYLQLLVEITSNIIQNDRRSGPLNLFWLAHSKEIAITIHEFFSQSGVNGYLRYQMHPVVRGFYSNLHRLVWRRFMTTAPATLEYNLGADFNQRLIEAIFDDQLPLTEPDVSQMHLEVVLTPHNRRFRMSFEEYRALFTILRERLRQGVKSHEVSLTDRLRLSFPSMNPGTWTTDCSIGKILCHPSILAYLFSDYESVLPAVTANPILKRSRQRRGGWHFVLNDYVDLTQALRRSETISVLRGMITLLPPGLDDAQMHHDFAEGRLYRFYESTEIRNTARKVTILFADLRGFTATSERGISEGELTRSLYTSFDPLAGIVKRFHGTIDKFTGDGVMITFGTTRVTPEDELNALRTAITIQEQVEKLRSDGTIPYRIGISLHTGRVQVARFLVDETSVDVTVIGRHVNIAGRLSGFGDKRPEGLQRSAQEEEAAASPVWIDRDGVLYNSGIAISQETVSELVKALQVELQEDQRGNRYAYFDEVLGKKVLIEYVGDAKFKGVDRSHPVYRVVTSEENTER